MWISLNILIFTETSKKKEGIWAFQRWMDTNLKEITPRVPEAGHDVPREEWWGGRREKSQNAILMGVVSTLQRKRDTWPTLQGEGPTDRNSNASVNVRGRWKGRYDYPTSKELSCLGHFKRVHQPIR